MSIHYILLCTPILLYALYYAFLLVPSFFYAPRQREADFAPKTLVVLPAYRPSALFLEVLKGLDENLPDSYEVYVLLQDADQNIAESVKSKFHHFLIRERSFSNLSGNSYQHALRFLNQEIKHRSYVEYVMILDKDNLVDKSFFSRLHEYGDYDFDIIQGKRKSIELSNGVTVFDNVSELLNDSMFRSTKSILGLPVEISGSGALIQKNVFCHGIDKLDSRAPGFDKNFMVNCILKYPDLKTLFVPCAILYEEKTSSIAGFQEQRLRWFGEQYYNAVYNGPKLLRSLFRGNLYALDYILVLARPPRSLMMLMLLIGSVFELIMAILGYYNFYFFVTCSALVVFLSSIYLIVHHRLLQDVIKGSGVLIKLVFTVLYCSSFSLARKNLGRFRHTSHKL